MNSASIGALMKYRPRLLGAVDRDGNCDHVNVPSVNHPTSELKEPAIDDFNRIAGVNWLRDPTSPP